MSDDVPFTRSFAKFRNWKPLKSVCRNVREKNITKDILVIPICCQVDFLRVGSHNAFRFPQPEQLDVMP
eukprot:4188237-Karenia_brevis.AAC.1